MIRGRMRSDDVILKNLFAIGDAMEEGEQFVSA
jgi:hypothetical protein